MTLETGLVRDPFTLGQNKVMSSGPFNRWGMASTDTENPFAMLTGFGGPFAQLGQLGFPAPTSSNGAFHVLRQLGMNELLSTDVVESPTDYHLSVELPGVQPDNCNIQMDGNKLTVRAERKSSFSEDDVYYHQRESMSGRVERSFMIPDDAQLDQATARYDNGILSISFPKKTNTPELNPNVKQIQIQQGQASQSQGHGQSSKAGQKKK